MNELFNAASTLLTGINTDVRVVLLSLISIIFIVLGANILVSIFMTEHNSRDEERRGIFNSSNKEDL